MTGETKQVIGRVLLVKDSAGNEISGRVENRHAADERLHRKIRMLASAKLNFEGLTPKLYRAEWANLQFEKPLSFRPFSLSDALKRKKIEIYIVLCYLSKESCAVKPFRNWRIRTKPFVGTRFLALVPRRGSTSISRRPIRGRFIVSGDGRSTTGLGIRRKVPS